MKVVDISVDFREKYVSEPLVTLEVDEINMAFTYEKHPINKEESIYVGSYSTHPFIKIYGHNAKNEQGFGGEEVHLQDKTGAELTVKGPWDCSVYMINGMIGTDYIQVKLKSEFSTRIICISSAELKNLFAQHNSELEVITCGNENGDVMFSVKELGKRPKNAEFNWEIY